MNWREKIIINYYKPYLDTLFTPDSITKRNYLEKIEGYNHEETPNIFHS